MVYQESIRGGIEMIRIINEETKLKRISSYGEFDNGHVFHNDWKKMSSDEAENLAKQKSLKNPDNCFYVEYDDEWYFN